MKPITSGRRDKAEQPRTSDKTLYPKREWFRPSIGGLSAPEGTYAEWLICPTALKVTKPFKNSFDQSRPVHIMEFFDPEDGSEYAYTVDTKLNKKGTLRMEFNGGLLNYFGNKLEFEAFIELANWYDPNVHDIESCGGAYTMKPETFGVPVIIGREARNVGTDRKSILQVFYAKPLKPEEIKSRFPNLNEYLSKYNEDGTYTEAFIDEFNGREPAVEAIESEQSEEALEAAIEMYEQGIKTLTVIKRLSRDYDIGDGAASGIAAKARELLGGSKNSDGGNDPQPQGGNQNGKIPQGDYLKYVEEALKSNTPNSVIMRTLKEDYGLTLVESKNILSDKKSEPTDVPTLHQATECLESGKSIAATVKEMMVMYDMDESTAKEIVDDAVNGVLTSGDVTEEDGEFESFDDRPYRRMCRDYGISDEEKEKIFKVLYEAELRGKDKEYVKEKLNELGVGPAFILSTTHMYGIQNG